MFGIEQMKRAGSSIDELQINVFMTLPLAYIKY